MDSCPNGFHRQGVHQVARNCDTGVDLEQQHERWRHQRPATHAGDAHGQATDETRAGE
jgi:hypothetical protein